MNDIDFFSTTYVKLHSVGKLRTLVFCTLHLLVDSMCHPAFVCGWWCCVPPHFFPAHPHFFIDTFFYYTT